jgi:uncharacterized protein YutE (UPF0331/DUF86 family)
MRTQISPESKFAEALVRDFLEEGYTQIDPRDNRSNLTQGYLPDLMFARGDEVVVVEIKSREEHRELESLQSLKRAIEQTPGWHFRLYVVPSNFRREVRDNLVDADKLIETASRLNNEGEFEAASVVLWMAIESSLRVLLTNRQDRPNPGVSGLSMARRLHSEGDLSDDDLSMLNDATQARNISVHGYRLDPRRPIQSRLLRLAKRLARKAKEEEVPAQ